MLEIVLFGGALVLGGKFVIRREKRGQTQTFESDIVRWGRGLPREGVVGAKKVRYVPRNQGNQTFWAGYPGILLGYPGGARKV